MNPSLIHTISLHSLTKSYALSNYQPYLRIKYITTKHADLDFPYAQCTNTLPLSYKAFSIN